MIRAVLFDYGGVLSPAGKAGSVAQTIGAILGVDPAGIDVTDLHIQTRKGLITDQEFIAQINDRYGSPGHYLTEDNFFAQANLLQRNEGVYRLAQRLRDHGIQTGILSNVYAMTAHRLAEHGHYDGFDPIILSCEEHLEKPQPEFYEHAIARLGVRPDEILFIDDQEKCIPPAQALGIHTILADDEATIVAHVTRAIFEQNKVAL